MTPTQGEHAQTEALYAAAMEFAAEKASISYVQRKCRCSYNDAERMLERMVSDGIIETYGGRKTVATTPAQPAPQGVAYAELPEPYGKNAGEPFHYTADHMRDFADRTHALRASNGQAPAGATVRPIAGASAKAAAHVAAQFQEVRWQCGQQASGFTAQAAPAAGAVAGPSVRKVFLVATGEEHEGEATYTRYDDAPPPLCDSECLYTAAPTPAAQADSRPAPVREEEREAFKAAHRHLELDEVPDAWGRPTFKHSHVEASWLGWIARAARKQGAKHD